MHCLVSIFSLYGICIPSKSDKQECMDNLMCRYNRIPTFLFKSLLFVGIEDLLPFTRKVENKYSIKRFRQRQSVNTSVPQYLRDVSVPTVFDPSSCFHSLYLKFLSSYLSAKDVFL